MSVNSPPFKINDIVETIGDDYEIPNQKHHWKGVVIDIVDTSTLGEAKYQVKCKTLSCDCNAYDVYVFDSNSLKKASDNMINHPNHYNYGKCETYDILEMFLSDEEFKGFLKGNVIKYLHRFEHKNGKEDLEKAKVYIDKLIKTLYKEDSDEDRSSHN